MRFRVMGAATEAHADGTNHDGPSTTAERSVEADDHNDTSTRHMNELRQAASTRRMEERYG